MDPPSSSPAGTPTTPRRQLQLQGPRPPRLNVRPESHAIKKPSSGVPAQAQGHGRREEKQQGQQPPREPVIIYDASPKIIHTKPSEFMALVQRLTGPGSFSGALPSSSNAQTHDSHMDEDDQPMYLPPELLLSPSAAMSPAARLATIERSVRPSPAPAPPAQFMDFSDYRFDDGGLAAVVSSARPGILSPLASSLPPAAASGQFSPLPFDASCLSWLNELSPILRTASTGAASSGSGGAGGSARPPASYYSDPFVPSPRNLLATPTVPSPRTFAELLSNLPDL
ncbi:hypothetical protein QYE76_043933 [Lolium multiflorum]|uniref:VQ domain-containing protein n=1 Tax=Lolium multiflorum TaxID=4521 RepID=A0AAD8WWA7_LOLMU|nr:hypothetical protein QYE76_043933 [Lolium multiflorum]